MASTATSVTVLSTARPWSFAAISASAGAATTEVGYNANKTDGSNAGGSGTLNQLYAYGQQHGNAGETAPVTVAVTPGALVSIKYLSGTCGASTGATTFGPTGDTSATTGISPTKDYTDSNGYVYPSNCMPAATNESLVNPTIGRVGLCGCFTDALGNIIPDSFWDWSSKGGTNSANSAIALKTPPSAAFVSMGMNDTLLSDNNGAGFSLTVYMVEPFDYTGAENAFPARYPIGISSPAFLPDSSSSLAAMVYIGAPGFLPLNDITPSGMLKGYGGQIFPPGTFAALVQQIIVNDLAEVELIVDTAIGDTVTWTVE